MFHTFRFRATPRFTRIALFSSGLLGGTFYLTRRAIRADAYKEDRSARQVPFPTLLRSYVVYSLCSIPLVVDSSPTILSFFLSIPGVRYITQAVIRSTFFAQFVGGDSAEDTLPILTELRRQNKGVLLAYSVEVDQDEAEGKTESRMLNQGGGIHKQNVEETLRCIDVAGQFEDRMGSKSGRKTWVAIKLTALLPSAGSLIALSDHLRETRPTTSPIIPFPGYPHVSDLDFIETDASPPPTLSYDDVVALKQLYSDLTQIAEQGKRRGVKIIVDAEYSWYQPAIDAFTQSLMRRFNSLRTLDDRTLSKEVTSKQLVQPLIYATYQAYLKRTPEQLRRSLIDAKNGQYSLGVKLVRGAYHPFEVEAAPSDESCPVWSNKCETDACYDSCAATLISALREDMAHPSGPPRLGVLFGTHNGNSCTHILNSLVKEGIAHAKDGLVLVGPALTERCAIGQLFGMSDALTEKLVGQVDSPSPFVIKYVPYGPLEAVMPYLSRRAIENKSILAGEGGAIAERRRIGSEIRRRLLGN